MSDTVKREGIARDLGPRHRLMLGLFILVVFAGGAAFFWKLWEFLHDLTDEDGLHFAGSHLLIYCLVAAGFLLLLIYGFLTGHFAEIEKPKFDMLEEEERHDRQEFA